MSKYEDIMKEGQAALDEEAKEIAARDKKMKAKGYGWRITAFIHGDGDDKLVDFYVNPEPTVAKIRSLLKKQGSRVLDDYTVEAI